MTIRGWGEVHQNFHIYLGSEHYFWFKISKSNTFGSMKICGYIYIFFFFFGGGGGGGGGEGGSLRNRTFFFFFFFWGGGSFLYINSAF